MRHWESGQEEKVDHARGGRPVSQSIRFCQRSKWFTANFSQETSGMAKTYWRRRESTSDEDNIWWGSSQPILWWTPGGMNSHNTSRPLFSTVERIHSRVRRFPAFLKKKKINHSRDITINLEEKFQFSLREGIHTIRELKISCIRLMGGGTEGAY